MQFESKFHINGSCYSGRINEKQNLHIDFVYTVTTDRQEWFCTNG